MYKCINCNKIFNKRYNYIRHIKKKNPCYEILKCHKCNKYFKQKSHYEKHINMKISCDLKQNIYLQKNIEMQLVLANKDIEIANQKILSQENIIKELKSENIFLRNLLRKNNINNNYNNSNNHYINSNNIILNINLHVGHITKEILDLKEKEAIKKIKNGTSILPTYDKQLELFYSEEERICAQYLMELIWFIWNHPELPENKIIKYFENSFQKYSKLGKWEIKNISQIQNYILKTIYNICKEKKIVKDRLNSILRYCEDHPKYELTKKFGNETFFNIMKKSIKKAVELL